MFNNIVFSSVYATYIYDQICLYFGYLMFNHCQMQEPFENCQHVEIYGQF